MSITINANAATTRQDLSIGGQKQNKNTIFAGNTGLGQPEKNGMIEQKKAYARKQAMKLIGDAWDRQEQADQSREDMNQTKKAQVAELTDLKAQLADAEGNKEALQDAYGVSSDSQEQKDLELLQKYQNYLTGSGDQDFSEEEVDRLCELQDLPRTEYQNKVLAQNSVAGGLQMQISQKESEIMGLNQSMTDAKLEQLKSQDMQNANEAADSIMSAASDEILGMLVQDGLKKQEEEQQEKEEQAKEAAQKKEEQQQQIDDAKEEHQKQDELLQTALDAEELKAENLATQTQSTSTVEEAQKNIQRVLQENNLTNEDLKGIKIDFNF